MDICIYTRGTGQSRIILGIHVDDQAITGPNKQVIAKFKTELAQELDFTLKITVYCGSTSALSMIKNPVQRQKEKHFNVVYHWVRECFQRKRLLYVHLSGEKQPADMFTKPLPQVTLTKHLKENGFGKIY